MPKALRVSEQHARTLAEISEFRGRTLYAGGRRPRFIGAAGGYADDDPLDLESYHVIVRADGDLIGCVRISHLVESSRSFLGSLVGPVRFRTALQTMNLEFSECVEAGRWIVAPSARGASLGRDLLVSVWVMGRWLGKRCLFAAVGVRDGQVKMAARWGGQTVPALEPLYVQAYDDELSVMYIDLKYPPPEVMAQLEPVERLLNLRGGFNGVVAPDIRVRSPSCATI